MDDLEAKAKPNKALIATNFELTKEGETSYEAVVMELVEVFGESSRGLKYKCTQEIWRKENPHDLETHCLR